MSTVLKLDRLEAHDRLEHLVNDQWKTISQGAQDCLLKILTLWLYRKKVRISISLLIQEHTTMV